MGVDKEKFKSLKTEIDTNFGRMEIAMSYLKKLFEKYYKQDPNIKNFPINKSDFKNEKVYNNFIERWKVFSRVLNKDSEEPEFSEEITETMKETFENIKQENNGPSRNVDEYDDINNIRKVKDYIKKQVDRFGEEHIKKPLKKLRTYDADDYVVEKTLDIRNIIEMNNTNQNFKIHNNPFIKLTKLDNEKDVTNINKHSFLKVHVDVKRELTNDFKIVTMYEHVCPKCDNKVYSLPSAMLGDIECMNHIDEKTGKPKPVKIREKRGFEITKSLDLYVYECELVDSKENFKFHIFSREKLYYGKYEMELLLKHMVYKFGQTCSVILIVLNTEPLKPEITDRDLIVQGTPEQLEFERNHGLPENTMIGSINQSLINVFKEFGYETINDDGALLQLIAIYSTIGRNFFNNRTLGISNIGTTGVSKTFILERYGWFLDRRYHYINNSDDVTEAGLKGGKVEEMINGKPHAIFREGLVTVAGFCVIDEAKKFYLPDKGLNDYIKNFLNDSINISKAIAGSGKISQNFTIVLLSNWLIEHDRELRKEIKRYYMMIRKAREPIDEKEVETMFIRLNIYKDISEYKNDADLFNAIKYVRNKYLDSYIDWRTGSRVESMNRILFDICVFEDENDIQEVRVGYTSLNPPQRKFMPHDKFYLELEERFSKMPDLKNIHNNPPDVIRRIDKIHKSIDEWIKPNDEDDNELTSGSDIFNHLSDNGKFIDSKLNSIMYAWITQVVFMEGNENYVTNKVKQICKLILMKFKKVLSRREYNLRENKLRCFAHEKFNTEENKIFVEGEVTKDYESKLVEKAKQEYAKEKREYAEKNTVSDEFISDDDEEGGLDMSYLGEK